MAPVLSVDAPQFSTRLLDVMFVQLAGPGWDGGWVSLDALTCSRSRLGPPVAVVAVARTAAVPAGSVALIVTVDQVSQLPVSGKFAEVITVPLTLTFIVRLSPAVVDPLA